MVAIYLVYINPFIPTFESKVIVMGDGNTD